jgi:hypothetical protein
MLPQTFFASVTIPKKFKKYLILLGERDGTRTHDLLIKSQLLYRLSYALVTWRVIWSENGDHPDQGRRQAFRDQALRAV